MTQNKYTTNNTPTLVAVSNVDNESPVYLWADPSTHALIASVSVSVPPPIGAANYATGQQALSSSAAQIAAIRLTRTSITIVNLSTTDIYIGAASVTTSTGQLLLGTKGSAVTLETTAAVYGIVASGTPSVSFEEEYS